MASSSSPPRRSARRATSPISGGYRTVEFGDTTPVIISSASFTGADWTVEGQVAEHGANSIVAQVICADLAA